FMLLAIGTGVALIPESVMERLTARVPARIAAEVRSSGGIAALLIFLGAGLAVALAPGGGGRVAMAQEMTGSKSEPPSPQGPEENWLVRNIMCQCGTCRH